MRIRHFAICWLVCFSGVANSGAQESLPPLFQRALEDETQLPESFTLWPAGVPNQIEPLPQREETNRGGGQTIYNRWITGVSNPQYFFYPAATKKDATAAIVVCPGGGYSGLAVDKEGHDTARWLNSLGITAIVLEYRTRPFQLHGPRQDVQQAIRLTRSKAQEWNVDPSRIGVLGYSAGGHLASTASTHFKDDVAVRPDFAILIYPVISLDEKITHGGSRRNIVGQDPTSELVREYSNDLQVSKGTPPTLLVHAKDDETVPIEHSRRMVAALEEHGVVAQLVEYETGGHGYGLGVNGGECADWPKRCAKWMRAEQLID